jgi:hypothetical protein
MMHLPQVDAHFYKERIERQTSRTLQQKEVPGVERLLPLVWG